MFTIPLAEELIFGQNSQHIEHIPRDGLEQELQESTTLDPSQRQALQQGLTQRVTLIQVRDLEWNWQIKTAVDVETEHIHL